jgi:tetratricopeptide (TPR) repeat protein
MQGMFEPAEEALEQATVITGELGDSRALADLANAKGALHEEQGNYRDALGAYRDSLRMRQSLGDDRSIGESLNNVGYAYYQLGEFDNAQTYWQQSASTYQKIDDRYGLVHAHQSQALAEIARGDWEAARTLLEDSLGTAESMQMAEEHTISVATLAELDRLEGRMQSAIQESEAALADFNQRKDQRGITEMRLLRSAIASDLGDWSGAARAISELNPEDAAEQASTLRWREAEIRFAEGHIEEALAATDQAIAESAKAHSYAAELLSRLLKVRILDALSNPAAASIELRKVKAELVRYASMPLRLTLAEVSIQIGGPQAAADYQEARNLLARLPSYGRAFVIHQFGSKLVAEDSAASAQRRELAGKALENLLQRTPSAQQRGLLDYAKSIGMNPDQTP